MFVHVGWVVLKLYRAENGCFIKPLPDRDGNAPWINVVANFNLTWKAACMEILQYVRLASFFKIVL